MVVVRELQDFRQAWSDGEGTAVRTWLGGEAELTGVGTHFGVVEQGRMVVHTAFMSLEIPAGGYFSIPSAARIDGAGAALVVTRLGYCGLFGVGGPVEEFGRLRYIDGCSDSVLVGPPVAGDPCLNFLHVPAGTDQTPHTHPSVRVGMVISGRGECRVPGREWPLLPGAAFILPRDELHSFHTFADPLRIVVYHPDSDCGPSHDTHPMVNRTHVDGVSAALLDAIRTVDLPG